MKKTCDCGHTFEYTGKDIYNSHRLLCGDATKIEDVERLMNGKIANVIVQRYVDYTGNNKIKLNGKEIIWADQQKDNK